MITGIVIAATIIGIGTWLRWVSRPAVVSIRYVLDLSQNQPLPARPASPARSPSRARTTAQGR